MQDFRNIAIVIKKSTKCKLSLEKLFGAEIYFSFTLPKQTYVFNKIHDSLLWEIHFLSYNCFGLTI